MEELKDYSQNIFESIKHINEYGQEFWYARELQTVLEYAEWRNFNIIIDKAKEACKASGLPINDYFVDVNKIVHLGVADRKIQDIVLSRYACYLIVMNGNPRKEVIALGQTYFAVKTREQELAENFNNLTEDEKRLSTRSELTKHNKSLAESAQNAGITTSLDYAIFQNMGYQGLYGGLTAKDIHQRKGLKKSQQILDHMGSTELAANLFRATQTDEKLRKENITDKGLANQTHYDVGNEVRQTIKRLGGTMPEDLPTPEKSIKKIEKDLKKKEVEDKAKN